MVNEMFKTFELPQSRPGYLMNFGEALMKDGITRILNGELPEGVCGVTPAQLTSEEPLKTLALSKVEGLRR